MYAGYFHESVVHPRNMRITFLLCLCFCATVDADFPDNNCTNYWFKKTYTESPVSCSDCFQNAINLNFGISNGECNTWGAYYNTFLRNYNSEDIRNSIQQYPPEISGSKSIITDFYNAALCQTAEDIEKNPCSCGMGLGYYQVYSMDKYYRAYQDWQLANPGYTIPTKDTWLQNLFCSDDDTRQKNHVYQAD